MNDFERYIEEKTAEVKRSVPCTDYLKKSKGKNMFVCPYCGSGTHANATGALAYYEKDNRFKCFACGESGDVLDLVQHIASCNFYKALQIICKDYHISFDTPKGYRNFKEPKRINLKPTEKLKAAEIKADENKEQEKQKKDYTEYIRACNEKLKDSEAAAYLESRGISFECAYSHSLGYDDKERRLIIPTSVYSYTGRALDETALLRYKNQGSPAPFSLSVLYEDPAPSVCFVTEGAIDALSLNMVGVAAVALNSFRNGNKLIEVLEKNKADKKIKFIISFDWDKDRDTRRNVFEAAEELVNKLRNLGYEAERRFLTKGLDGIKDINDLLIKDPLALADTVHKIKQYKEADSLGKFYIDSISGKFKSYPTGLTFIDSLTGGGFMPQTLTNIIAAPGIGKTALCQQLAERLAEAETPVLYFNFEMSREQMLSRTLSRRLHEKDKADLSAIEVMNAYKLDKETKLKIETEIDIYRNHEYRFIKYITAANNDIDNVIKLIRYAAKERFIDNLKAPIVFIDYLHLLTGTDEYGRTLDNKDLIKKAMLELKRYAIEYETLVFTVAAVNRESMKSKGKINMNSTRDSSNAEYGADYIISLNKKPKEKGESGEEAAPSPIKEIIITLDKGRSTAAGAKQIIFFDGKHSRFYGIDESPAADGHRVFYNMETGNSRFII